VIALQRGMSQQKAVILRLEGDGAKSLNKTADEMELKLAAHVAEGWRLAWASPFSGTNNYTCAMLVLLERP
jgi:hypothetical protein